MSPSNPNPKNRPPANRRRDGRSSDSALPSQRRRRNGGRSRSRSRATASAPRQAAGVPHANKYPALESGSHSADAFEALGVSPTLARAVHAAGYETPTPIQEASIAPLLEGRDLLGCAQTGTGKTAAFALPILDRLANRRQDDGTSRGPRPIRTLILAPTRELAIQIADSFCKYGRNTPLRTAVVFGGVGKAPQVDQLRRGVDVLVATPGRLIDLMGDGEVRLDAVEIFVLDEADRMLDMGFIRDVRRITGKLPRQRQTLLFSATMPGEIRELAHELLDDPISVAVDPVSSASEPIEQSVLFVEKADKPELLGKLLEDPEMTSTLVFTRTKHGANRLVQKLERFGVQAAAIHGNKSQTARQRALESFKAGRLAVLVATDIAARGIDVKGISHVVNFELPNEPESYVHRIGRTGRAGRAGIAIAFCDRDERAFLRSIERLIGQNIQHASLPEGFRPSVAVAPPTNERNERPPQRRRGPRPPFGGNRRPQGRRQPRR
ncbi:MAG: ATP-dependent helicase [Acidobacteria bacterium]|nr:MAG: ATP-dependent helicase [Acidobacteriota bacterium]